MFSIKFNKMINRLKHILLIKNLILKQLQCDIILLQIKDKSVFMLIQQQISIACLAHSRSPSNPMNKLIRILRGIHLNNRMNILKINTSGTNISADQYSLLCHFKLIVYFVSLFLFHLSVHLQYFYIF